MGCIPKSPGGGRRGRTRLGNIAIHVYEMGGFIDGSLEKASVSQSVKEGVSILFAWRLIGSIMLWKQQIMNACGSQSLLCRDGGDFS